MKIIKIISCIVAVVALLCLTAYLIFTYWAIVLAFLISAVLL